MSGFLGVDAHLTENVVVGLMGGGGKSDVDFDDRNGDGDNDSWQIAIYASVVFDHWFADVTGGYGDLNIESQRNIAFGTINRVATVDYDGGFHYFNGRTGYNFDSKSGWSFAPEVSVAYIEVSQDAFDETGAGNLNLSVDKQSHESLRVKGLLRIARTFRTGHSGGTVTPYATVGVAHEFEDDPRPIVASMIGSTSAFTSFGEVAVRTTAVYGAGLKASLGNMLSIFVDYVGETGSGYTSHQVTGGGRIRF